VVNGRAFALSVLYAHWLEKFRGVMAPIVGHDVSDGVELGSSLLWVGAVS